MRWPPLGIHHTRPFFPARLTVEATCSWVLQRLPGPLSTQRLVVSLAVQTKCMLYTALDCSRAVSVILKSELARSVYGDVASYLSSLSANEISFRRAFLGNNELLFISHVVFLPGQRLTAPFTHAGFLAWSSAAL